MCETSNWFKITKKSKLCAHTHYPSSATQRNFPHSNLNTVIAKGDSGASNHYWRLTDLHCLNEVHAYDGPTVMTPTLDTIKATQRGQLPLPTTELSKKALTTEVFKDLTSASLISFL